MSMSFEAFIEAAWNDHADHPQAVADRLAAALHDVQSPEHVAAYARLVTHLFGEHLGAWQDGAALLESLRAQPVGARSDALQRSLGTSIATLRYGGGDAHVLHDLSQEARAQALATAAAALIARAEDERAIGAYADALHTAEGGLPAGSPAVRALAVGGNNLAAALEERDRLDAMRMQAMLEAAAAGLRYWKLAGTWVEEERAEYQLARCQLRAGRITDAVASATRCVEVCMDHGAPPLERFFGHAVLALAQRAAGDPRAFEAQRALALQQLDRLPAAERDWCERELRELGK